MTDEKVATHDNECDECNEKPYSYLKYCFECDGWYCEGCFEYHECL